MLTDARIRTFARDLLARAIDAPCPWALLQLSDDGDELLRSVRVLDPVGALPFEVVDETHVPIAARVAASHVMASGSLQLAVLEQDARYLTPADAQQVIAYAIHRTFRAAA